jgi:Lamin Tail Domain/Carbohydrate binding domain/CotH kinase protein
MFFRWLSRVRVESHMQPQTFMRRLSILFTILTCFSASRAAADTSLVFNEIMYHPATNEAALEWVELRNQMAVDVDLSGWSLRGEIEYTFASNTIVRGGAFIVVALSPSTMTSITGSTNGIFGPFTGRLSNGGGNLRLHNNSGRLVDEVNYGTEGDWPAAADGSGASLAKRDRDSASGPAANWTWSEQVGGTPMAENFAVPGAVFPDTVRIAADASWKYDASGTDLGTAWRESGYNDTAWASRANLTNRAIPGLFNTGVGNNGLALANNTPDPHYVLTANANGAIGGNALSILNHPAWLANNTTNTFIGVINPGSTTINGGSYHFQTTFSLAGFLATSARINIKVAVDNDLTDVFINGASSGLAHSGFAALSAPLVVSSGFVPGVNTLEFRTVNQGAGPGGFMATVNGTALAANTNAPLPLGPTTYYFRKAFTFSGDPTYTQLRLNSVVADGAVVYLNGVEVYRQNMPTGLVTSATSALSDVVTPSFSGLILIPSASLVVGTNVLAVEAHQAAGSADGPLYGAELISTPVPVPGEEMVALSFNETSSSTNAGFWLELMNRSASTQAMDGMVIQLDAAVEQQYVFPPGTSIAPGGFLAITNSTLGFTPSSGDRLYLFNAAKTRVFDAVVVKKTLRARSPDGTGPYLFPNAPTPGAANSFSFRNEIVINEIMYHHGDVPGTNGLPVAESLESWLELHNKSANPVDLTDWELDGGISYRFFGQTIAPGGYLVVAKDAAYLRTIYPSVTIVGNFSGKLGRGGDEVILRDPSGNPADQVRYFDSGRWPSYADGGGSSLELRDPNADNSKAEAWAASIEAGKTPWQNYSYRMVAAPSSTPSQDATWRDFIFGLLGDGETWIDDLSVIQSPTNGPIQVIANGNFENGLTGWRVLGNHIRTSVELDPDNAANHVLRLVATGPQEHMNNHIEATLTAGRTVLNGTLYEISFRARHIAGNNLVNTRFFFNRVARSTPLATAALNGTPGARNSTYATNVGPTFAQFQHTPVVPAASTPVTVSVAAQDAQGVTNCAVWWSANGGAWASVSMTLQPGGLYSGNIPAFPAATVVQFYVRAVDGLGAVSTFPAAGPASGALYTVADGQANLALTHNIRIILTPANTALLHADTNVMSNDLLPCTVVFNESRAYYDAAVHLKSSEHGRNDPARVGFHLVFQPDDLFRGVHPVMLIDRSNSGRPTGEEILLRHMALRAGVPMTQPDLCRVIAPRSAQTGQAIFSPRYEDEFMETAFENGGDGTLFEFELIYYLMNANADGYKLPAPDNVQGLDISNVGDDKEAYRYTLILKNHRNEDDYSRLIAFAKSWSIADSSLETQTSLTTDWDEWMRSYSLVSLFGVGDMYTFGNNHNLMAYQRPSDQKMVYFLWDMDFSFNRAAGSAAFIGDQNLGRIVNAVPSIRRCFYAHLQDHVNTVFNTAYMTYWFNRYDDFTLGQDFVSGGGLGYIQTRGDFAKSTINSLAGNAPFSVTGTNFIVTSNNLVTLSGTAPFAAKTFRINGREYPITWTTLTNWTVRIAVSEATNVLNFAGYDVRNQLLTNIARTVTVNYTGPIPDPAGIVVINEIMYNPLTPDAAFLELHNTSTNFSFDLSDWRVNGIDYTFPPGSLLTNRQFLALANDSVAFVNAYGSNAVPFDTFSGNLQNDGETLTLFRPGPTTNSEVEVDKVRYENAAPWPATANGGGAALQLLDAAQDNSRVGNWSDGSGWRFVSFTGSPVTATTSMLLFLATAGDVYVDNIVLVTGTVATVGANLFQNGSFENGLAPWTLMGNHTNSVVATGIAQSGSNSLHIIGSGVGGPGGNATQGGLSLSNAGTYTLSFWVLPSANGTGLNFRFTLSFRSLAPIDYRPTPFTPGRVNAITANLTPFAPVWLNEVQADNIAGITDNLGQREPWVEIYNAGTNVLNLAGYYLANNYSNLTQWPFPPGAMLQPGEFRLVFCDAETNQTTPTEWHANFRPATGVGSVGLVWSPGGAPQVLDYLNYTNLPAGRSYGEFPDGQPFAKQEFYRVTPAGTNDATAAPIIVYINEWMAANTSALLNTNNNNKYDDWFELYNPGATPANLAGYYLTDNLGNKFQYAIPQGFVIPPHSYKLVWADNAPGKNDTNNPDLHVNFALSKSGEALGLFASDGTLIDAVTFGPQFDDRTEGRFPDGPTTNYFLATPTPRASNTIWANRAPVLPPIPDATAYRDVLFTFNANATDADAPLQTLTYSLTSVPVLGASIDPVTGVFSWTPSAAQTPTTNTFTVRVTDNGSPALNASRTFRIITAVPLLLGGVTNNAGQISFTVGTTPGKTYRVLYKNDLNDAMWTPLGADIVATGATLNITDSIGPQPQRFYQVVQLD